MPASNLLIVVFPCSFDIAQDVGFVAVVASVPASDFPSARPH